MAGHIPSLRAPHTQDTLRRQMSFKWAAAEQVELLAALPRGRPNTVVISAALFSLSQRLLVNLPAPQRAQCYCIWLVWRRRGHLRGHSVRQGRSNHPPAPEERSLEPYGEIQTSEQRVNGWFMEGEWRCVRFMRPKSGSKDSGSNYDEPQT